MTIKNSMNALECAGLNGPCWDLYTSREALVPARFEYAGWAIYYARQSFSEPRYGAWPEEKDE